MYCRKCGTEQKEGQRFCPKCGESFGNENKMKEQAMSFLKNFISNPDKVSLATKAIACLFTLWFFIKSGFSISLIWYLAIVALLYVAFMGIPRINIKGLQTQYITAASCFAIMIIVSLLMPKDSADISTSAFGGNAANESPHEVFIYNDVEIVGSSNKGYQSYDIVRNNGNYGVRETINSGGAIITDVITIPRGKKWKYERDESTAEGNFYTPMIYHYQRGDENNLNNYRSYKTRNKSNVPIFYGGDKILIFVPLSISPNETMSLHLKVYFTEVNDEFTN